MAVCEFICVLRYWLSIPFFDTSHLCVDNLSLYFSGQSRKPQIIITKARDTQGLAFPESDKIIQMVKACKQSCVAGVECPHFVQKLEA